MMAYAASIITTAAAAIVCFLVMGITYPRLWLFEAVELS